MIMKPWKTAAALLAAALAPALGLTSCGDTETEWVTAPTVSAAQAVVTAPDEGGTASVALTVTNPAEGATVSASPSASWVEVTSCTETALALSVSENPNSDPRTARVTVSYSYSVAGSKGTATCEVTVAQSCGDQPALSVQPTAVAAAVEGGSYSFSYTIVNPAPDGEVSASCTASWISDIDCSVEGSVGFGVEENPTTALRQAEITLSYSWANGSISESVTVVQDHEGGSDEDGGDDFNGDIDSLVGIYTAGGYAYYDSGVADYTTWTLTIYKSGDNEVIIDGLVPEAEGMYPSTEAYIARASLNSNGQLVIPTQYTGYYNQNNGNYIGWTPCTKYETGNGWYYSSSWPDCTVTYDPSTGVWTSDYGMFLALFTTNSFSTASFAGFYDVTNPGFQFTKSGELPDDPGDGGGDGDLSELIGTYNASGDTYYSQGVAAHKEWTLRIFEYSSTQVIIDGLVPACEDYYASGYSEAYVAKASMNSSGQIVIPAQFTGYYNSSGNIAWTPCTKYEEGTGWYRSSNGGNCTLTYDSSTGIWTSDYGMFLGVCSTYGDISTWAGFYDVSNPGFTITKVNDDPKYGLTSANQTSSKTLDNAPIHTDVRVEPSSATSAGLVTRSLGVLNMADAKPAK